MSIEWKINFDENTYRHFLNDVPVVMHCHHYMSLTTQLAENLQDINGVKILRESAEDSTRELLDAYFKKYPAAVGNDRLQIAREYYSMLGMGKFEVFGNENGGEVKLIRSHVDEGWVKKFGPSSKFVNHFTCGFVAAMFAAAFDRPARSFNVYETASIAMGETEGKIIVKSN